MGMRPIMSAYRVTRLTWWVTFRGPGGIVGAGIEEVRVQAA